MVARKVFGFHEPRPHATRAERVERTSRGPIRGPAPSESPCRSSRDIQRDGTPPP